MARIWTMGEILVEVMRRDVDKSFLEPDVFIGPFPSGAPAIFIDTVARLGGKAGIIGTVGNDDFGKCVMNRLEADGVDISEVKVDEKGTTGVAFVTYFSDGERRYIFHLSNSAASKIEKPQEVKEADLFHVMGCSMTMNEKAYEEIISTTKAFISKGAKVSFDPNIRPELLHGRSFRDFTGEIMKNCSFLLPGVEELKLLSGKDSIEDAVSSLFENPVLEVIALKRGKHGCTVYTRDSSYSFGIYDIPPMDATGAGDCFDGAFLQSYLSGLSMEESIKVATAAASLNTGAFGPMEGKVSHESIAQTINGDLYIEL